MFSPAGASFFPRGASIWSILVEIEHGRLVTGVLFPWLICSLTGRSSSRLVTLTRCRVLSFNSFAFMCPSFLATFLTSLDLRHRIGREFRRLVNLTAWQATLAFSSLLHHVESAHLSNFSFTDGSKRSKIISTSKSLASKFDILVAISGRVIFIDSTMWKLRELRERGPGK